MPSRRVAVLAGAASAPGVEDWASQVVAADASTDAEALVERLDDALQGPEAHRLLVSCPDPGAARLALATAVGPHLRQRCAVTALVRSVDGPPWLDDIRALVPSAVPGVLDGAVQPLFDVVRTAPQDLPAVACWMASVVASGASAGVRLRAAVGPEDRRVVLDAADGVGVGIRLVARTPA